MIRTFVAVPLPAKIRDRLALMAGGVPGARWVSPENMHLTLRFIGDVDEARLEDIDLALKQIEAPAFTLELQGIGQFTTGRKPRTLWVGVAQSELLSRLHQKTESALVRAGFPREERKFAPHVTLARLKEAPPARVGRFLQTHGLFQAGPISVDRFGLYESHMGRDGASYQPIRIYPLDPAETLDSRANGDSLEVGSINGVSGERSD